ncbi:hypothetical protein [Actinomadura sp. NTSP31]|uniref:hypothetical protein n=1 Tax=Actinomadura sp. NTSP31 TaxID=1735447 RepID=UPI0035C202B4
MKTKPVAAPGTERASVPRGRPHRRLHLAVPAVAMLVVAGALSLGASLDAVMWSAIALAVVLAAARIVTALDAARRARR